MKQLRCNKLGTGLLVLGLSLTLPVAAQMSGGGVMEGGKGMDSGSQQKGGAMGGQKGMSSGSQKMGQGMKGDAGMQQMSGMMGKGMMMDGPNQKQLGDMRMQMDQMMKGSTTMPKKK